MQATNRKTRTRDGSSRVTRWFGEIDMVEAIAVVVIMAPALLLAAYVGSLTNWGLGTAVIGLIKATVGLS